LIVRSIRRGSKLAAVGSLIVSFVLLASYAFLWVVVIAELFLVLVALIVSFRRIYRSQWKHEVALMSGVLFGGILIPIAFLFLAAIPLLGYRPQALDPGYWLALGWDYLTRGLTPQVFTSAQAVLEEAFDFAGNRADLPFLTLLSIVGVLDGVSQTRSFNRIMSATILVPFALTLITPGLFHTWRGLYIIPMYLTGALGAESIIRRVNGQESPWRSLGRLAFAGTFAACIFLSHLSYSLRALELLIIVGSR